MLHDPPTTIIGVLHVAVRLPLCRSLKEKRSIIRPCVQHLQDKLKLSACEIGDQNEKRRAIIAAAVVSSDKTSVERILQRAGDYFDSRHDLEVLDLMVEIL